MGMASVSSPPYLGRLYLARLTSNGFVDWSAQIHHSHLRLGRHVFIGDRVVVYENKGGGVVALGDGVRIMRDTVLETGQGGRITIGEETFVHPRCQLMAYKGELRIGSKVQIAPGCAFYPYNHGVEPDAPIKHQPLVSEGGITIGDESWIGYGVIVLDGVSIGRGAVVGAGAVVTKDVPENAIAVGVPARVVRSRHLRRVSTAVTDN